MPLSAKVGQITQPTSTGNQATTGVGFQPKIVLFWMNNLTSDGSAANAVWGFGAGVSSSQRQSAAGNYADGGDSIAAPVAGHSNTKCIFLVNTGGSPANVVDADVVSLDSDGFTLNWTTVDATARKVNYLSLGGTDLTNVKTGQFQMNTSTGNQAVTGIGFQPDSIMFFGVRATTTAPPSDANSAPRNRLAFGKSSSKRGFTHTSKRDDTNGNSSYQRTDKLYAVMNGDGTAVESECDLVSLDSDGFTVNWTTVGGSATYVFYIALKGGQFNVGSFNQPTSNGSQAVTGNGFTPSGIILTSDNFASSTSIQNGSGAFFSMGAGTSSSNRVSVWDGAQGATILPFADHNLDSTKIIKMMQTAAAASPTTQAAADLTSLDSDGFTLNWTTTDATAREILYFAFGSVSGSASPSVSPSQSPSPSISPSRSPSVSPSVSPSISPSVSPSRSPSRSPSVSPSASPSQSPSASRSPSASVSPSVSPSPPATDNAPLLTMLGMGM